MVTEFPSHLVVARANDHDSPLPDQPCLHVDRGYDSHKARDLLEILGYDADLAAKGSWPLGPAAARR